MKNTMKMAAMALIVSTLAMVSCQKEEYEPIPTPEGAQEEGFTSKTGNNDSAIEENSEILTPLLHKRYDASISLEEAETFFEAEVAKFVKDSGRTERSSHVNFVVAVKTGARPFSETDGYVFAAIYFKADRSIPSPTVTLNDPSRDDRERDAWDFYYYGWHVPSVRWIELSSYILGLQGTDGWYAEYFDVAIYGSTQAVSATGISHIWDEPNVWLDNATSSGVDYYFAWNIGRGRVHFD